MRVIVLCLVIVILSLQYKLWFGNDGLIEWMHLSKQLAEKNQDNKASASRNFSIATDIAELKRGEEGIEERARYDLGMVKQDEVYYQFSD